MRTDTTVRDVMHREFLGVSESDSLSEAAALMVEEETNCLVVVRGGEPVGRLACRDALDALLSAGEGDADSPTVGAVMGPPLPTVSPDDSLAALEERLVAEGADRVVAVEDGEAVGVVTDGDALAAGAPRVGPGAGEFGADPTGGEARRSEAALSATAADADAAPGAAATMDPDAAGRDDGASTEGAGTPDRGGDDGAATGSSTQGVCENCGALVPDLATDNGQAVCPDCREI